MGKDMYASEGFMSSSFLNFTPMVAYKKLIESHVILLDVREKSLTAYKRFDVPVIVYIPFSELTKRFDELSKTEYYIVADSIGLRSHEAMLLLIEAGFTNIANLAGGIVEWERDGLPLKINSGEQLDGSCMCQLRPRLRLKKR